VRAMNAINARVAGGFALVMAVVSLAGLAAQAQAQTPATVRATESAVAPALKVGDVAPDFALTGSDGATYSLASYKGVKPIVLAWFPRTPIKD
jgi:cytochrome oxidase Cu insertion factor (SCO1/SenC/PrrC family)